MIEVTPIELELRKLGLTEKEVRVYLASLELGPSSVLNIAQKTGLARPTTYEIVKSLENKGLFAETKQKKKRYFVAQSPERILGLLRVQKEKLKKKRENLLELFLLWNLNIQKKKRELKSTKAKRG